MCRLFFCSSWSFAKERKEQCVFCSFCSFSISALLRKQKEQRVFWSFASSFALSALSQKSKRANCEIFLLHSCFFRWWTLADSGASGGLGGLNGRERRTERIAQKQFVDNIGIGNQSLTIIRLKVLGDIHINDDVMLWTWCWQTYCSKAISWETIHWTVHLRYCIYVRCLYVYWCCNSLKKVKSFASMLVHLRYWIHVRCLHVYWCSFFISHSSPFTLTRGERRNKLIA